MSRAVAKSFKPSVDETVEEPTHLNLYSSTIGLDVITCLLFGPNLQSFVQQRLIFDLRFLFASILTNYEKIHLRNINVENRLKFTNNWWKDNTKFAAQISSIRRFWLQIMLLMIYHLHIFYNFSIFQSLQSCLRQIFKK